MQNFSFLAGLEVTEKFVWGGGGGWVPSEYYSIKPKVPQKQKTLDYRKQTILALEIKNNKINISHTKISENTEISQPQKQTIKALKI